MKPILNNKQQLIFSAIAILAIIIIFLLWVSICSNSFKDKPTATAQNKIISQAENLTTVKKVHKKFYGVDISKWNGNEVTEIDPTDSLSFIICKATEGNEGVDTKLKSNWRTIKDKEMILGAYHFYHTYDDPKKQASHYWKTVTELGETDMVPIVDIEEESLPQKSHVNTGKIQQDLLIFLELIKEKSRRTPMIYTGYSFANQYLKNPDFAKYSLWLAEYNKNSTPKIPNTWQKNGYKIWQKNDSYNIDFHPTDFDIFYGERSELYE